MLTIARWQNVVDFVVLAGALYVLLRWAQGARALRIALAIAGLHIGALIARHFDLAITAWVLDGAVILTVVLLILLFQSEVRRAFMRLDSIIRSLPSLTAPPTLRTVSISRACFEMAISGIGALIVIARRDSIAELIESGVELAAAISSELLESIFQKTSPLHDGAVVLRGDRVALANAVLPLTQRQEVPQCYGTRHRAAMGLAERCDALVIAVSEERHEVTLMDGLAIRHIVNPDELAAVLNKLQSRPARHLGGRLRRIFLAEGRLKLAALGLAGLIWGFSVLPAGTSVRIVSVPIEFRNVPAGMAIGNQSTSTLDVQLRGNAWIMDSMSLPRLVAHVHLNGGKEGWQTVEFGPDTLDLPPGVVVERIAPAKISVRLVKR